MFLPRFWVKQYSSIAKPKKPISASAYDHSNLAQKDVTPLSTPLLPFLHLRSQFSNGFNFEVSADFSQSWIALGSIPGYRVPQSPDDMVLRKDFFIHSDLLTAMRGSGLGMLALAGQRRRKSRSGHVLSVEGCVWNLF
ncbi:hypothetical protein ACHQM5_028399 [Ranunculus cassubicifolius]